MTADPLEKIRAGLLTGVAAEPRRAKRRRVVAALVAVAALFAGGVALASPWGDRPSAEGDDQREIRLALLTFLIPRASRSNAEADAVVSGCPRQATR